MINKKIISPYKIITILVASIVFIFLGNNVQAANNLSGRILLQVQDKGQAWYINPANNQRYFLKASDESVSELVKIGLGVSNKDFLAIQKKAPARLLGRILIKVEDKGKAYYLNPIDKKLSEFKKANDVSELVRKYGLGATNASINKFVVASDPQIKTNSGKEETNNNNGKTNSNQKSITFTWKYKNKDYYLNQNFSHDLYQQYVSSPKSYTYYSNNAPANPRDNYYQMLISAKSNDSSIDKLLTDLKSLGQKEGYSGDSLVEFVLAFVQYIPYDYSKNSPENIIVNYPYETLYKQKGVCSDKSFLAALLLRKMGYGSVILDLPEANHTAIGIQCPVADSTYGSGYCFVETTNYFPIGTLPQSINSGQANSDNVIDNIFNTSHLGKVEYYQKTFGSLYYGITNTKNQVALIKSLKAIINNDAPELKRIKNEIDLAAENLVNLKKQLEQYRTNGDWIGYNNFTVTYNAEVVKYNAQLEAYQVLADLYNTNINKYNQTQKELFQN